MNPTDDVQSLRRQLATAQAKLQEYNDIIISQANELRILRDNLCQNCKKRFTPSPESNAVATSSSALLRSRSSLNEPSNRQPFWRRILNQSLQIQRPNLILSIKPSNLSPESPPPPPPPKCSIIERSALPQASNSATAETRISSKPIREWYVEYQTESRAIDVTFVHAVAQEANVICVKFSRDGKYLAVALGNFTGRALIYETESAKLTCVLQEPSQDDEIGIGSMCFTPDSRHVVTTSTDDRIRLWKISEKRVRSVYRTGYQAVLDISANGRFLACAAVQEVIMWRIRDGSTKIFRDITADKFSFIKFSRSGLYIVTVDCQDVLRIWNVRTGHLVARWTKQEKNTQNVKDLGGSYHYSRFWTVSSVGADTTAGEPQEEELLFTGHTASLTYLQDFTNPVAVSPDGRWVISYTKEAGPSIRDVRDGLQQCTLRGIPDVMWSVDFCPTGNYLAIGTGNHFSVWKYKPLTSQLETAQRVQFCLLGPAGHF